MRRMRGALWDFNRFSPGKPCQKRLLLKMWFLIFIHLSMKASPEGRLIVTQDPCFLEPRESAISHAPSFEHAVASAALAASF